MCRGAATSGGRQGRSADRRRDGEPVARTGAVCGAGGFRAEGFPALRGSFPWRGNEPGSGARGFLEPSPVAAAPPEESGGSSGPGPKAPRVGGSAWRGVTFSASQTIRTMLKMQSFYLERLYIHYS